MNASNFLLRSVARKSIGKRQLGFIPTGQKPTYEPIVFPSDNINEYAKTIDTRLNPEQREYVNKIKKMYKGGAKSQRCMFFKFTYFLKENNKLS